MPKLPRLSAKEASELVESKGFVFGRQSGSHAQYYREGVRITLSIHGNTILHPKIVKQIYLAIESFKYFIPLSSAGGILVGKFENLRFSR